MSTVAIARPVAPPRLRPLFRRILPLLITLLALLLIGKIWWRNAQSLNFDDSFMFLRYARHLRAGYGIAWNPGGPHTFGLTSLPWLGVIYAGSFLTSDPARLLVSSSILAGVAAMAFLAWSVSRHASSAVLRDWCIAFSLISLPLVCNEHFNISLGSGMETMLALFLVALFADQILALVRSPGTARAVGLAVITALATLTRPEALLPLGIAFLFVVLLLLPAGKRLFTMLAFSIPLVVLLAATLLWNRWYFGSAVPLAFYIKSMHGYKGMRLYMNPFAYTAFFLATANVPLLLIAAFAQRRDGRLLAVFLLPALAIVLYLFNVLQIMGWGGRYYIPYLPLLILPAFTILDRRLVAVSADRPLTLPPRRLLLVAAVLFCSSLQFAERFYIPLGRIMARRHLVYAAPHFTTANPVSLPQTIDSGDLQRFAAFAATLPAGVDVASTEVGILGVRAEHARILDMAGLNDDTLARRGFSTDYLFAQQPDVIWLPHTDYTDMVGRLATDPRLLGEYDVYPAAFALGVALRRSSPVFPEINERFHQAFAAAYPGLRPEDFRATAVSWKPAPRPCEAVFQ